MASFLRWSHLRKKIVAGGKVNDAEIYSFISVVVLNVQITDPKDVQHILSTNFNNYVKPQGFLDAFQEAFDNSLFILNHNAEAPDGGAGWRLQRKVTLKVFTTANFRIYTEKIFARHAEETMVNAQAEAVKVRDSQSSNESFAAICRLLVRDTRSTPSSTSPSACL